MAREMKDSGIEWIGEIPDGWIIRPLKGVTKRIIVGLATSVTQYYRNNGIPLFRNLNIKDDRLLDDDILFLDEEWASTQTGKMIRAGDILTVHTGYIGISCIVPEQYDNALTFTTLITTPKPDLIDTRFLMRYINVSRFYSPVYFNVETGAQNNLNTKAFINLEICVPDQMEQKRIIAFLDEECSRIDSVIDQTRASIEEYKKLKQAVITQAVTKGIRPDRQMKDSGNKWLSAIPVDWKLSRVGLHFDITLGKMLCSEQPSDEYTLESYFCAANVHFDGVSNDDLKQMWFSPAEKEQYLVTVGDLLVVEGGAGAGGCAVVTELSKAIYIQNSIMIVRSRKNANVRYLKYLLEFLVNKGYIDIVCNKATIPHFTKDKLANVPFAVSDEQEEIAHFLDKKTADIDALVLKKESIIQQLEQYKKSLIYEYITGKKEVPA